MPVDPWIYLLPASFLAAGILVGWVVEKVALARVRAYCAKHHWDFDNIIIDGVRGLVFLWLVMLGLHLASRNVEMTPESRDLVFKIQLVVLIFSLTIAVGRIAAGAVNHFSRRVGGVVVATSIFTNLIRIGVFVIGMLVILQSLGISITPMLTALGVGGLAVALALQDTLSNLFAGLQIIIAKKLQAGDYIRLDTGEEGYITDITWRNTTVRTLQHTMVVMPNLKLASAIVTNFNLPDHEVLMQVPIGVGYDSDLDRVERITVEVAREVLRDIAGGVPDHEPQVRYHAFADSSIAFNVVLRAKTFADQFLIRHEFIKRLHVRYRAEGIELPYPVRTVLMKSQLATT